jgi:ribosomal protein S14
MSESFYERLADGERRCRVCADLRGHALTCPLPALRLQVRELASQIGLHVATMRELLEDVDALVRGDREAP